MTNPNRTGFQGFVNQQPAPAKPGDFAGSNPRTSVNAGPNGFVSDGTVTVGYFAFGTPNDGNPLDGVSAASGTHTSGSLTGFVHSENQGIIVPFLAYFNEVVQDGFPVTLMSQGDFWAQFTGAVAIGAAIYADATTGQPTTTSGGNIATPFKAATSVLADASFTGTIAYANAGDTYLTLTVSGVTGTIEVGQFVNGAGVGLNVQILQKVDATHFLVSGGKAVTTEAMTSTEGKMVKISSWQN